MDDGGIGVPGVRLRSALPGRERWDIEAVRGRPRLAAALEAGLSRQPGVLRVQGNAVTGRLLLCYRPDMPVARARWQLRAALALPALPAAKYVAWRRRWARGYEGRTGEAQLRLLRSRVTLSGTLLATLVAKRLLWGAGALAATPWLVMTSLLVSALSGYPALRREEDSPPGDCGVTGRTPLGSLGIGLMVLAESIEGLVVLWLANLTELWLARELDTSRLAIQRSWPRRVGEAAPPALAAAADDVTSEQEDCLPPTPGEVARRRFADLSLLLAGTVLMLTGDTRRALAMLLLACPSGAPEATPLAAGLSVRTAGRRGIYVRDPYRFIAAPAPPCAIVFAKTGVLTAALATVERVLPLHAGYSESQLLMLAAAAELGSRHPFAVAVLRQARERRLEIPTPESREELPGCGVAAVWGADRVAVGNRAFFAELGIEIPSLAATICTSYAAVGESMLLVAHQEKTIGLLGLRDPLRANAAAAIARLRGLGVRTLLLTGDHEEAARWVARATGISEWHADLPPGGEMQVLRELQAAGYWTTFVAAGAGDAAAIRLATLGIAAGPAAPELLAAAGTAVVAGGLEEVAEVHALGLRARRVLRQNDALMLGINASGLGLAALGAVGLGTAAVVHTRMKVLLQLSSARLAIPGLRPPLAPSGSGDNPSDGSAG